MLNPSRLLCAAVVAAALAGCGSSGGSVPRSGGATPTPTPGPTTAPIQPLGAASAGGGHGGGQCPRGSAPGGCPSVYALSSDPSGVAVRRSDPSGQTSAFNATFTTPANDALPDSSTNLQYAFTSTTLAAPFVVRVQQVRDGAHQVYYNRAEDSVGTVDAGALPAAVRRREPASGAVARVSAEIGRLPGRGRVPDTVADRVYVRFHAESLRAAGRTAEQALRALGLTGRELRTTHADPLTVVAVPAAMTAEAFASALHRRSDVAAVYPVHVRRTLARAATIVNDPHAILPDQWYTRVTGFPNAWSYSKGSSATIAVIDTGVDLTNSDLAPQVVFSESVIGGQISGSEVDNDGHGTNIAGIADAVANNGLGFAGAAYGAKLIAISIFGANGTAAASDDAIAIGDAVTNGADVINLGLGAEERFNDPSGYSGYDEGEAEAVASAIASGATVVAPSGNDRDGLDPSGDGFRHFNLDYPAAYPNVIAVGASKLNDNDSGNYAASTESVASYSQSGNGLAVVAPGGEANASGTDPDLLHWIWNYYSTAATTPCSYGHGTLPRTPTNCTALFNGTSQAAAQVSGAAALLYAAAGGHHALSAAQVTQLIQDTADNINDPNQGHGRLNAYRALAALTGDSGATPTGPAPVPHSAVQTIAFAYNNSGSNRPVILDYDFPAGVPIDPSSSTFRIADVRPQDAATFKVAVWYDANGNGIIDAGDAIAVSSATCTSTGPCVIGTLRPQTVTGTFTLP